MVGHLTEEEIKKLLQHNILGRLGCTDGTNVQVVPITYVYDGGGIICHSRAGTKINWMRSNPNVCFEVDEIENFSQWKSVVVQGRYRELEDETEKLEAMNTFVNRLLRIKISETARPPELSAARSHPLEEEVEVVVYRIDIEKWSGRFEDEA
jgi:uncharacterized protein